MRPSDEIENVIKKISFKAGPEMDKDLWAETSKARNEFQKTTLAPSQHNIWRKLMKSPLTKLSAAAIVAIACLIVLSLWRGTQSGIALADVLAQVEKARTGRWSFSMSGEGPGRPAGSCQRGTFLISREWGQRVDLERIDPNGKQTPLEESYGSLQKRTLVEIDHPSKRYARMELDEGTCRGLQEGLRQASDPAWFLKGIMKYKYERLGRSTVDGVEVEGFRTTDPNFDGAIGLQVDIKLWVDVKTRMPVRVEQNASGVTETGGRISFHGVLDHYQWDFPVAASEFEPPGVPDGYLIVADTLPGPLTEEGTIQGLQQCVELLGKYPGNISLAGGISSFGSLRVIQSELDGSDSPAATRLKEELKGLTEQERVNRLMDVGTPMRRVYRFFFFVGLMNDRKESAYYGKTVTPKDADKVLMRWKVSESEYRVIFGDLHAETISPKKLAELEAALPK